MTASERAQRVAEIVEEALEREPSEVMPFLDDSCGGDPSLRQEVESLLGFQKEATDFIEAPAYETNAALFEESGALKPGDLLGEYKILSLLGEGGMGEVYLAEDAQLGRKVAIKLVKAGFGRASLIRHFYREERILAGLNDPYIARLYGGAVTPDGIPYFVMEYVEGERLDRYCDTNRLSIAERLQLFRRICSAVSYAHQHLVIHRDLKPANIRVTPEGDPKLLDFGIAKLLEDETTQAIEQTMTMAAAMTPEYASPEQVRGERMTTASDVYSLGVILYELLTGTKPYRIKTRRPEEISRAITEQEPPRPSAAIAQTNSPQSGFRNPKLLRGDLDNIVLMAMRKEPSRRYSTVEQFSNDIQRHLDRLPVIARRDTVGYRASKFVKRHAVGVAAAALIVVTLIGGIVATASQARRAERQRARAERRFNEVRQLANSLMFEIHDSVQDLQGSTPTRRLIVSRALQYLDSLAQETGDNPALQRELATAYEKIGDIQGNPYSANLGDSDGALASYRKAAAIREALSQTQKTTESQMEMGRSYRALGDILEQKGDITEMIRQYRRSLELFEELGRGEPDNTSIEAEVARAYETLGDGLGRAENAAAERSQSYRKALDIRRRLLAREPSDAKMQRSVALSFLKVGSATDPKEAGAAENIRTAIAMLETLANADTNNARARREVGFAYYQLGRTLIEGGDAAGALESRQKAFVIRQQIATQDPKNTQARFDLAVAHADLSDALIRTNKPPQALEHGQQALEILELLCAADPSNAVYQRNLGLCLEKLGEAHERSAADESSEIPQRRQAWSDARESYRKAAEVFSQLRARGTLMPSDAGLLEKLEARAAECERAIQELTAR